LGSIKRLIAASGLVAAAALIASSPAMASRGQDFVTCDNGASFPITVTNTSNDNSVAWGVGTISGGNHLIPTSFSGSAVDTTVGVTLFSFSRAKGNGNGQHNQMQLACQTPTDTGTVADFLGGEPLPQEWADMGVSLTDEVTITFTVNAVLKP
jgi:hypothetical protein